MRDIFVVVLSIHTRLPLCTVCANEPHQAFLSPPNKTLLEICPTPRANGSLPLSLHTLATNSALPWQAFVCVPLHGMADRSNRGRTGMSGGEGSAFTRPDLSLASPSASSTPAQSPPSSGGGASRRAGQAQQQQRKPQSHSNIKALAAQQGAFLFPSAQSGALLQSYVHATPAPTTLWLISLAPTHSHTTTTMQFVFGCGLTWVSWPVLAD